MPCLESSVKGLPAFVPLDRFHILQDVGQPRLTLPYARPAPKLAILSDSLVDLFRFGMVGLEVLDDDANESACES